MKKLKLTFLLLVLSFITINRINAQDLNYNNQNWNHLTASYLVDLNLDGNEMAGKMSIRMRKDSIIWFSISASIGIQIAKGIINKDSIHFLDLYNRHYYAQGIKDLPLAIPQADSGIYALRFIQGIFTGSIANGGQFNYENAFGKANITYDSTSNSFPPPNFIVNVEGKSPEKAQNGLNNIRLNAELKTVRFDAIPSYPFSVSADYERK
jgi:hypothetical protein